MSVFFFFNMEQLNSLLELFDVSDAFASSCEIFDDPSSTYIIFMFHSFDGYDEFNKLACS